MENSTMQNLFGPLSKQYCLYFYFLSIIGMVFLVMILVSTLFIGITKRKGIDFYLAMLSGALAYGIFYFQNRLLHSMCAGSI
jgi:hypothetical protein